jgi:hypothetical protein
MTPLPELRRIWFMALRHRWTLLPPPQRWGVHGSGSTPVGACPEARAETRDHDHRRNAQTGRERDARHCHKHAAPGRDPSLFIGLGQESRSPSCPAKRWLPKLRSGSALRHEEPKETTTSNQWQDSSSDVSSDWGQVKRTSNLTCNSYTKSANRIAMSKNSETNTAEKTGMLGQFLANSPVLSGRSELC